MKLSKESLMLSELRVVGLSQAVPMHEVTDDMLLAAVTANEELMNLGYTLSAKDIVKLASSAELNIFPSIVKNLIGDVKAKPMYPDFPKQVMNMDEATFRFHQVLHYFSTYGVELFTGMSVNNGWLPEVEDTEKTEIPDKLLSAKTLGIVAKEAIDAYAYKKILEKCERMTDKDQMLISELVKAIDTETIIKYNNIPFKENVMPVFFSIFAANSDKEKKLSAMKAICKHTGDVFKCADYALTRCRYHFKTSQKRLITNLLETYNINDFSENVIISNKKSNRVELILRYLDFNSYAKKKEFKSVVSELRDGDLRSWMSNIERRLAVADTASKEFNLETLNIIAKRPGMAIRMISRLIRLGFDSTSIRNAIKPYAGDLRTQTLISILNSCEDKLFSAKYDNLEKEQVSEIRSLFATVNLLLMDNLYEKKTSIRGKKVYLDLSDYVLECSRIETNDKSAEGGYVRSGIAYRIPENVDRVRFFVYWNHKCRSDIDLHACMYDGDGNRHNIGWNAGYKDRVSCFSGDITHSNAAEYIDIDLKAAGATNIVSANTCINLYYADDTSKLGDLDEVYVGAMAVNDIGQSVKLYDPKNCFFTHNITSKCKTLKYGYIDVIHRCIKVIAKPATDTYDFDIPRCPDIYSLSMAQYICYLMDGQECEIVNDREDADIVLVMGKPNKDNEVSLIDNNFFMDV